MKMKSGKNLFTVAALAVILFTLQSCDKVTASGLDGTWDVTAGKETSTYTSGSTTNTTTTEYTSTTETITVTGSTASPTVNQKTISYAFDNKTGTYTTTIVATESDVESGTYYTMSGSSYNPGGSFDRKVVKVSTTTQKGTYTITGGTGEIEKASEIVLKQTDVTMNSTSTNTYFVAGTSTSLDITGKYEMKWGIPTTYPALAATSTSTSTSTGTSSMAMVFDVVTNANGVMDVTATNDNTYTSGATTTVSNTDYAWTLTKRK